MRVNDVMDPTPAVASVPSQRAALVELFSRHKTPGFPVLKGESRKLVGVVFRRDLLRNPTEDDVAVLMNPNPFTIYAQAPLREAAGAMKASSVPLLPVVSGSNDLLGLVSAHMLLDGLRNHRGALQTHLQGRVVPLHRGTPTLVAREIHRTTGARAFPILDDAGHLTGLVTDGDLLQHDNGADASLSRARRAKRPRSSGAHGAVEGIMAHPVHSLTRLDTVGAAATLMTERGFGQVPIVDSDGRLVDLLTDLDLIGAWL